MNAWLVVTSLLIGTAAPQQPTTRFAVGPIRVREWTPVQMWTDANSDVRVGSAGVSLERTKNGTRWEPWGVLPFGSGTGLAPFSIGPEATIAPSGDITIHSGFTRTAFTKIDAIPDSTYRYRIAGTNIVLSFLDTGHGDAAAPPYSSLSWSLEVKRPFKPYLKWLKSLRCPRCSIDIRTDAGWQRWNERTAPPSATFRLRQGPTIYSYPVVPNS